MYVCGGGGGFRCSYVCYAQVGWADATIAWQQHHQLNCNGLVLLVGCLNAHAGCVAVLLQLTTDPPGHADTPACCICPAALSLQLFFECHKAPRLLFMEEDLEIAPDFFSYFSAFAPVLERDKSLMCVSAWNDHGQRGRAVNNTALYRTDIFPGLGWMLTAELGRELHESWPNGYWDEYMREPKVRKGRQCIFPEVPRTHTFGKVGTSGGQFFDQHLAVMLLNKEEIDWSKQVCAGQEAGHPGEGGCVRMRVVVVGCVNNNIICGAGVLSLGGHAAEHGREIDWSKQVCDGGGA